MFVKVGWIITWLFAPLAGIGAVGIAIVLTLTGYDELVIMAALAASAIILWLTVVWGVARLIGGRARFVYLVGCAAIAIGVAGAYAGYPFLAAATGHPRTLVLEYEKPI